MVRYDLNLFEIWKPIPGYEGMYDASTEGRIWSRRTNKILTPIENGNGYKGVNLGYNNRQLIHRLVCMTFVPNPDPEHLTQVNHINEDKSDNRSCNLEWCDSKYNLNYGERKNNMLKTLMEKGHIKYPNMTKMEKKQIRNQLYHNAHKEELKEKMRLYYQEHCEELKEKARINYNKKKAL